MKTVVQLKGTTKESDCYVNCFVMRAAQQLIFTASLVASAFVFSASSNAAGKVTLKTCEEEEHASQLKKQKIYVAWFHASWCPTCAAQQVSMDEILKGDVEGAPFICKFDYDETEDLQEELNVARQSTFIRYADGAEKSRIVGKTSVDHIKKFLEGR